MGFRVAALKGARWFLWLMMAWIMVRGVASFVMPPRTTQVVQAVAPPAAPPVDTAAPGAFASLFAKEYLTYAPGKESDRALRLQGLISSRLGSQAGWSGAEKSPEQVTEGAWPYQVKSVGEDRWLVTVAARVATKTATGTTPRTVYLAVPVLASAGGYLVYDFPTYLPAPEAGVAAEADITGDTVTDSDGQIRALLSGFFRAYSTGGPTDAAYFLEPGVQVRGLAGAQVYKEIYELNIRRSGGETWASALVVMEDPTMQVTTRQRYTVQVVERDGRWYIKQIVQKGA